MTRIDHEQETSLFRVLIVSNSDVSRGPAAHRILRHQLRTRRLEESVVMASAGADATAGQPMHPYTARALTEVTIDPREHAAHRVSERRLAQADLILTATRAQFAPLFDLRADVRDRTFTLLEFARLAASLDPLPLQTGQLVVAVADARAHVRPLAGAADDDLVDPAAGASRDHERLIRRIDQAMRDVSRAFSACLREPMSGVA